MTGPQIVSLYRSRSEDAIRETEKKYGDMLRRLAFRYLQNEQDAEECVGDAYLAVWNLFETGGAQHLKAYLCRTVRNLACDRLESRSRQKRAAPPPLPLEELSEVLPDPRSPERELDERELTEALNRFLRNESERRRYIFVRRYFYCDGVGEIASALGTSESAVSVALNRVRKKLKEYLRKEGFSV